jgi:hypothetical protein
MRLGWIGASADILGVVSGTAGVEGLVGGDKLMGDGGSWEAVGGSRWMNGASIVGR